MNAVAATPGRLAGSAAAMVMRKVGGSALQGITAIVVVRCLAPDEFGRYAAGLAAYYLLLALTEFGFGEVLGRGLGRGRADPAALGRLSVRVGLAWSAAVAVLGVAVAAVLSIDSTRGATLLVLTPAVALAGLNVVRQYFYAYHEVGRMAAYDLAVSAGSAGVVVTLAILGAPAVALAATASAASVANSLVVLRLARKWMTGPVPRGVARDLFREAAPIGVASFLSTAYVAIDVVLLSWLFPSAEVGGYAAAVKVMNLLTIFPGLVLAAALPGLAAVLDDPERLRDLVTRLWHWFACLVLPAVTIIASNARGLLELLFGTPYAHAAPYLRILVWAAGLSMLAQLAGVLAMIDGRTGPLVTINLAALIVSVGGTLLLVTRAGLLAAAGLLVATEAMVCAARARLVRDRVDLRSLLRVSRRPVLATLLTLLVATVLAGPPLLVMGVAAAVYAIAMTALRGWPAEWTAWTARAGRAA